MSGVTEQSSIKQFESVYQIVICDRGWVFAGDTEQDADGITIRNAVNIRRWGTEKGLGQLAQTGATENTVIDPYGCVRVPTSSVVATLACGVRLDD